MSIYSGVLPYAVTGEDIFFLVGQEKSGMWSDFGGKINSEETITDCAIREACEESMGFLNIDQLNPELSVSNNKATIFGYEIDYIPEFPELYNNSYTYHSKVLSNILLSSRRYFDDIGYLEKIKMKWITYSEFLNMKPQVRKISRKMIENLMLTIILTKIEEFVQK